MTFAYLLLFLGLFLIFIEFFLPGGLLAVAGIVAILFSFFKLITLNPGALEVIIFLLSTLFLLILTIRGALWLVKRTGKKGTIFLESDQTGWRASSYDLGLKGEKGICYTPLRPGGFVIIGKKKYDAISLSGFLEKGDQVEVVEVEGETLKVKLCK